MIKIKAHFINKPERILFFLSTDIPYLLSSTRESMSQMQGHADRPRRPRTIFDSMGVRLFSHLNPVQ